MTVRLAHYVVGDAIGAGSFATVHLAVDEQLDDRVAIKILAENHSLNPEIRERFIAEGRSLRKISGRHAVAVYDIGESDRMQPYLVLELADRGTLRDHVDQLRSTGWVANAEDLLTFARSLAAAVGAVHSAHLVHRDLSPGNLLLTSQPEEHLGEATTDSPLIRANERLLIADLGMCKDLAVNSGLTVSGGTEGFRPPEQNGPGIVDYRADIWAMSALLGWVARGTAGMPALAKVLKRGMSDRPKRRQPNAATWLAEVEEALAPPAPDTAGPAGADGVENRNVAEAAAPGRRAGMDERQKKRKRVGRRWVLVAFAAVAVIALVGGFLLNEYVVGGHGDPPSAVGSQSIGITGPAEIAVGETATYTADIGGVSSWAWTLPNNRFVANQKSVTVTATTPGTGVIVVRSQTSSGAELEARRTITVTR